MLNKLSPLSFDKRRLELNYLVKKSFLCLGEKAANVSKSANILFSNNSLYHFLQVCLDNSRNLAGVMHIELVEISETFAKHCKDID